MSFENRLNFANIKNKYILQNVKTGKSFPPKRNFQPANHMLLEKNSLIRIQIKDEDYKQINRSFVKRGIIIIVYILLLFACWL